MKLILSVVALISLLALTAAVGCSEKQKKVEAELASPSPINCATAAADIQTLKHEKANVAQRVVEGGTAVYPASAIVGLIAGIESTKIKVATGSYNKAIDARIAEIQQECGEAATIEGN